jgi:hypothetical protein
MTTQIQRASHPISRRREKLQDFLLVSSFGFWTSLLGLAPVLTFRLLLGS